MAAYYNENDEFAAAWLRELIRAGHIAAGHVDTRSIVDVQPDDLRGYTQCHFFAGIGGWSYALRLAGWPDDRPVWTGSCPCQPLSGAGQRKGHADERHLWPAFHRLIAERRPATVFGEQVASSDGREWLAGVRADLEAVGYAVGAADMCAAGVGAPHIRQRLYWLADASEGRRRAGQRHLCAARGQPDASGRGTNGAVADTCGSRLEGCDEGTMGDEREAVERSGGARRLGDAEGRDGRLSTRSDRRKNIEPARAGEAGRVGDADGARSEPARQRSEGAARHEARLRGPEPGCGIGHWSAFDLIPCTDGKARRVEPGSFPLAHGIPNRVGRLRAYGNAIVPQVAAAFIRASIEAMRAA